VNSPGPAGVTTVSSISRPTYGQALSFTTTVAAQVSNAAIPTGTVQFQIDGTNLGSAVALTGGMATSPAVPLLGAGSYTITTLYSGDLIYPPATGVLALAVAKAVLTVAAVSQTATYGGPIPALAAAISGFVGGDTSSVVSGMPTLSTTATNASPAGVYPINVGVGTLSALNYTFSNLESGQLTVTRAALTVTASNATSTYGSAPPSFSATITGFRNGDGPSVVSGAPGLSTAATSASPVGTYPIHASAGTLAAANYVFTTFVDGTLTVTKAHLTVTASNATSTYGSPIPPLTATLSGLLNGDSPSVVSGAANVTTTATPASPVGLYSITASVGTLTAANYDFPTFRVGTLTVTKAHLTVTATPTATTYGAPLPSLNTMITGLVNGDTRGVVTGQPSLSTTATSFSPVGTYPIAIALGTLTATNYDFPNLVGGTLTVNKAHLTVAAVPASSTYGGPIPPLSATISGYVNGDGPDVVTGSPVVSTTATPASHAGAYPITVLVGTLATANYDFVNLVSATLTVNKAHLTVTADDKAKYQGSPLPPLTATITGFVNGDTPVVVSGAPVLSTTATPFSPVGTYPITVAPGTLAAPDYDFPNLLSGTLTVTTPGGTAIAVAASDPLPTYGEPLTFTATVSVVTSGAATPTGTVQFLVDGASIGLPIALTGGTATSPKIASLPAGTYTVTADYSGDETYGVNLGTLSLSVAKAHLTVTANPATSIYGAPIPPLGATLSGFVNGDTAAVVSGSAAVSTTATPTSGVGAYPTTVSAGTLSAPNYDFPNLVGSTLTITRAPLTVTADFKAKVAGSPNPPLTASITGFVNGDTTAVVSGSPDLSTTATASSPPGVYPITVSTGTLAAANYAFTTFNNGSLDVIAPGDTALSIVSNNPAPLYGQALTFTATVVSGGGGTATPTGSIQFAVDGSNLGSSAALSGGSAASPPATGLGAGTHTITAFYSGDARYPPNVANPTVTVGKAHLTVAASSVFTTYGSATPALAASISGFVGSDTATVVSGAVSVSTTATTASPVGLYPITVGAGSLTAANYDFTSFIPGTLTVSKAHLTVAALPTTSTYGSPIASLSASISGFVNGDTPAVVSGQANLSTTATPASGVGLYPIAVGPGTLAAANYDFPNLVGSTLTITRAHLTVTANAATTTYGAPLPALSVTISGLVGGDPASAISGVPLLSTAATASSPAGTYPITVGLGTLTAANYDFPSLVAGTLTINKAHLTVTASPASSVYGSPIPSFQATISGFVAGDGPTVVSGSPALSTTATPSSPVGVYPIAVAVGTLAAANYDFANLVASTLTITRANLTVTADPVSNPYGSSIPALSVTFGGFVAGDTPSVVTGAPSISTTATPTSGVGVYPITVGPGTLTAANYNFNGFVGGTFTITPAHLTVTANDASSTYGDPIPALSATISGLVNGDSPASLSGSPVLSTTAAPTSGAGVYAITVALGTLSAANYDFPNLVAGTLTIAKAHLTVTAAPATSAYGAAIPPLSATLSGFVAGDGPGAITGTPSLSTAATPTSGVGVYPITVGPGTLAAANYDFPNLVGSSLTVTKAHLTVTANPATSIYDSPVPPLGVTITGFVGGDTAAVVSGNSLVATAASAASAAGSYPITVSQGTLAAANYDFTTFASGTLTIAPAPATLSLGNLVFTYDGSPRLPTVTSNPPGLGGVTISTTPANGSGAGPSGAGSYTVMATLDNPNYTAASVSGTLVINPAVPTITWANPADVPTGTALGAAQLDATASVPGSFSYSPAAGTMLNTSGVSILSVRFTPADSTDYLPAMAQVMVNVVPVPASGLPSSPPQNVPESNPTETTPPALTIQGVRLQKLTTGKHRTSTVIVVQFSGAPDPATAINLGNYSLVSAGKDRKLGTRDDRPVRLARAIYDPGAHTVTLIPRKPLVLNPPLQLRIAGAVLTGSGGTVTVLLSKKGITLAGLL
jgi:hypothetical protein